MKRNWDSGGIKKKTGGLSAKRERKGRGGSANSECEKRRRKKSTKPKDSSSKDGSIADTLVAQNPLINVGIKLTCKGIFQNAEMVRPGVKRGKDSQAAKSYSGKY